MTEDDIIDELNRDVMAFLWIPREYMSYNLVRRILTEIDINVYMWYIKECNVMIDYDMALLICIHYYKRRKPRWDVEDDIDSFLVSEYFLATTELLTSHEIQKLETTLRYVYE